MASAVNPITSPSTPTSTTSSASSASALSTPSESMFLNLLVAQMKNQDPLNPTDSTQFVSQLAQFSELEQVIGIRTDTDKLATSAASSTPTTTPSTNTNTPAA
jgi:flagellar basal-body rod modification protein FlgD